MYHLPHRTQDANHSGLEEPRTVLTTPHVQITGIFQAIGAGLMAIVNGIAAILKVRNHPSTPTHYSRDRRLYRACTDTCVS